MRYRLTYELERELRNNRKELEDLSVAFEIYRIKAAMYYSFHMRKWDLGNTLAKQLEENNNAIVGEFDGFSYASWRANAVFRTLEDMFHNGMITRKEYEFCKI